MGFSLQKFMEELVLVSRAGYSDQYAAEAYYYVVEHGYKYALECGQIEEVK